MYKPLVSIVVPCYNHESYIKECILSIVNQDYRNIELIVIDDGSTDKSTEKIEELRSICEARFVRFFFKLRKNKGLAQTLNEAISECKGEFYAALASDDKIRKEKTSKQVDYLRDHPECVAVFSAVELINATEEVGIGKKKQTWARYGFREIFLREHNLPAGSQMIRLSCLKATGGFPDHIIIEDWYMWLKLIENGGYIDRMEEVLASYRRHNNNVSKQFEKMSQGRLDILDLFRDHPLYNKALARATLASASDFQVDSKLKALHYIFISLAQSPEVVFSIRFIKTCIKQIVPSRFLFGRI